MIDDLNRMEISSAHTANGRAACSCETCGCECSCTDCQCYCSSADYTYDQDNTYLRDPSDRTSVSGNLVNTSQTSIWQMVML